VRQSNRISITRVILPPDVVRQTLEQLPLREATMALIDAVTALRASELVALKWRNVGWHTGILRSEFAFVQGELKDTKSRSNALPLARPVLNVLRLWREHTPYRGDEDWIFASPHYHGKTPYTYQILFRRHIRPVIERVSGLKSSKQAPIGWHTLRRSLATLLISNGENVKVAQSQLRHTTPKITLELYAQAVSADQQKAHRKVVQMVLPAKFSEKLKARSAAPTG
jgi:integrase